MARTLSFEEMVAQGQRDTLTTETSYPRIPYNIRHSAVNEWSVNHNLAAVWFDRYYLLHWQGVHLAEQVNNGTLKHDGVQYKINWITVPTICYQAEQVQVSFRRILGQAEGYALIKVKG